MAENALRGRRVAVTGGTGFVGARLLPALRETGAEVVAILRTGHDAAHLRSLGVQVVIAPLRDAAAMARALAGVDVLIHLAYDVRASGEENLRAFNGLMDGASVAQVGRIVHLSSVVVYRDWPEGRIIEGADLSADPATSYRGAKVRMEKHLESLGIPSVVLQPTIVWGAGSALWTEAPLRRLRAGGIVLPEVTGLAPLVHVADLVSAILAASTADTTGCEKILISGDEQVRWRDLYDGYSRIAGVNGIHPRPMAEIAARLAPPGGAGRPSALARVSAIGRHLLGRRRAEALLGWLSARRKASGPAWPDRGALALYTASPEIVTDRARTILGFAPRMTLALGLEEIRAQSR